MPQSNHSILGVICILFWVHFTHLLSLACVYIYNCPFHDQNQFGEGRGCFATSPHRWSLLNEVMAGTQTRRDPGARAVERLWMTAHWQAGPTSHREGPPCRVAPPTRGSIPNSNPTGLPANSLI